MALIPVNELIGAFQVMLTEHWKYVAGGSMRGAVDCSGAFVYAFEQFSDTIAHGSNAIARNYILKLHFF